MRQILQLKGNEFYAVRDLYDDLLKLLDGWKFNLVEGIAFLRVSSDKKKGRVKVTGKLAGVLFTLTVHDDSAILISEQQCRDIVAFVYDIVALLTKGVNRPSRDVPSPTEEEAQKWVERCTASSDEKYQCIANNIVKMGNIFEGNNKNGWHTNKYRIKLKFPQDNEALLKTCAQMYGGEKLIALYMKEIAKDPFYLVVIDNILYYDSTRLEYFESVFKDMKRITMKFGTENHFKFINVDLPSRDNPEGTSKKLDNGDSEKTTDSLQDKEL